MGVLLILTGAAVGADEPPPLAMGFHTPILREVSRKDMEISIRFWMDELARSLHVPYKPIRFYDDIAELKRDMTAGKINFLVATSIGVARQFSPESLSNGFAGYKNIPDHLCLVVRRDSRIQSPADLARKRLALLDNDELTEVYLATLLMKAWGKADLSRIGTISYEERSSKLAHRLFFNQADAAMIYRSGFETALAMNPQIGKSLTLLEDSCFPSRSPHIGLFSSNFPQEYRDQYTRAALKMNDTLRGRQVLEVYHSDAIVETKVEDLAPFQELLTAYRSLKTGGGTTGKGAR